MTLKSNGCIIFIAALSPTKLVVTSKHSLGEHTEGVTSHAMMGEIWLHRHLEKSKKTSEELAQRLWKDNITAVAEVLFVFLGCYSNGGPMLMICFPLPSYAMIPLKSTSSVTRQK